jgi:hypothetical protein
VNLHFHLNFLEKDLLVVYFQLHLFHKLVHLHLLLILLLIQEH